MSQRQIGLLDYLIFFKLRSWNKSKLQPTKLRKKLPVKFTPIQLKVVDKNSQSIMRVTI